MRHLSAETFVISRSRARVLDIKTIFVVDRSLSKVPVIKVESSSSCLELPLA